MERTEICHPHVVLAVNGRVPWAVHAASGKMPDLCAVGSNRINSSVTLRSDPCVSLGIDRQAPKLLSQVAKKLLLKYAVDESVLCNTSGVFTEGKSTAVGDPRGSVGGKRDIERTTSLVLQKTHNVMRISV